MKHAIPHENNLVIGISNVVITLLSDWEACWFGVKGEIVLVIVINVLKFTVDNLVLKYVVQELVVSTYVRKPYKKVF
jgi:hypothetical protein